ncbi:hypothetical protein SUNI508_04628 [Seiridium unicorne]|uniref:Uncharacterized protein n=1 Tax=Seiridium unicorne TaxID=138068 RepID=A0ABR2V860_9PEZI
MSSQTRRIVSERPSLRSSPSSLASPMSSYRKSTHEEDGLRPAQEFRLKQLELRTLETSQQVEAIRERAEDIDDQQRQDIETLQETSDTTQKDLRNFQAQSSLVLTEQENLKTSQDSLLSTINGIDGRVILLEERQPDESVNHMVQTIFDVVKGLAKRVQDFEEREKVSAEKYETAKQELNALRERLDHVGKSGYSMETKFTFINRNVAEVIAKEVKSNTASVDNQVQQVGRDLTSLGEQQGHLKERLDNITSYTGQIPYLQSQCSSLSSKQENLQELLNSLAGLVGVIPGLQSCVNSLTHSGGGGGSANHSKISDLEESIRRCWQSGDSRANYFKERIADLQLGEQQLESKYRNLKNELEQKTSSTGNVHQVRSDLRSIQDSLRQNKQNYTTSLKDIYTRLESLEQHPTTLESLQDGFAGPIKSMRMECQLLRKECDSTRSLFEKSRLNAIEMRNELVHRTEELTMRVENQETLDLKFHQSNANRLGLMESTLKKASEQCWPIINYANKVTTDLPPVYPNHYVAWLRSLDFRLPDGMKAFKDVVVHVPKHLLFSYGKTKYILYRHDVREPFRGERDRQGFVDDDAYEYALPRDYHECAYRHTGYEIKYQASDSRGNIAARPKYVVGSTGFHLFMDITSPQKSLWVVFADKVLDSDGEKRNAVFRSQWLHFRCFADKPFDVAMFAQSVHDWNQFGSPKYDQPALDGEKVKACVQNSAQVAAPTSTYPNLKALFGVIGNGWSGVNSNDDEEGTVIDDTSGTADTTDNCVVGTSKDHDDRGS